MADVRSAGGWVEVVAPGVSTTLNPATMPHALVSEADGTFTFKQLDWATRDVGDDVTNPVPSFVGNRINDVFFTRNRLGFLTSENVVMSRAGGQFFNFFRETATQVLDTDPIDLAATEKDLSILTSAVPFNEDILLFSPKTQFRFTSGQDLFTPKTVQMKPVSKFDNSAGCVPVSAGSSVYFTVDRQKSTGVMEYVVDANTNTADALEITEHVPRYLPPGIHKMVVSTSERIVLALSREDPSAIYAYSYYARGDERLQSSWSRWSFEAGATVLDIAIFGTEAVLLIQRLDGVHLEAMRLPTGRNDGNTDFVLHLDRRLTETQVTMTYDPVAKVTTINPPYNMGQLIGGDLQVWERFDAPAVRLPRRIHHARLSGQQIVVPGDARAKKLYIGFNNPSEYEFSEQFLRQDGTARTDGRLQLRRMRANFARTGGFAVEVTNGGRELTDNVDLYHRAAVLWEGLKHFENDAVRMQGVTLVLGREPGFADTAPLTGQFLGVLPDGRFYAEVVGSGTGEAIRSEIGPGGWFSFPRLPTGVKTIQLVRARDGAPVHAQHYGHEGPGGVLMLDTGSLFLVGPNSGLVVDIASGPGTLLRAWNTRDEDDEELRTRYANRCQVAAQAKAVLAACTWNAPERAARWLRPLIVAQALDGQFPTELDPKTLETVDGTYARGTQLWTAMALGVFAKAFPSHALRADAIAALNRVMTHLTTRIASTGFLNGLLLSDGGAASSHDNFLAYFAYWNAYQATGNSAYLFRVQTLGTAIDRVFWLEGDGRYASAATSEGVLPETQIAPNWLAPLFAARVGSQSRALLARQWFDYFETSDGSARGYANRANDLTHMGAFSYGVGGLASEQTFHAIISKVALGERAAARLDWAKMTPLMSELGVRNAVTSEADVRPFWDVRATAMAIVALNPQLVFGVDQTALWLDGLQPVTRNPPFRYVYVADTPNGEGRFDWPVGTNSANARVVIKSLGALPFSILSASWEGYFTARSQKV